MIHRGLMELTKNPMNRRMLDIFCVQEKKKQYAQ